jgi:hypothetical protein
MFINMLSDITDKSRVRRNCLDWNKDIIAGTMVSGQWAAEEWVWASVSDEENSDF